MITDLLKEKEKKNKFFKYYEYEYEKYYPDLGIPESKTKALAASVFLEKNKITASSLIDIGCGPGVFLKEIIIKLNIKKAAGTELSMHILEIAQKNNPSVSFYRTNNKRLPFKNEEFDISSFIDVLEHIPNPDSVVKEAMRISKYVLVKIPLESCIYFKILNKIQNIDWKKTKGHINIYSFESFNQFMKKNGLVMIGHSSPKINIFEKFKIQGSLKYRLFEITQIPFLFLPFRLRRKIIITEMYAIYSKK